MLTKKTTVVYMKVIILIKLIFLFVKSPQSEADKNKLLKHNLSRSIQFHIDPVEAVHSQVLKLHDRGYRRS